MRILYKGDWCDVVVLLRSLKFGSSEHEPKWYKADGHLYFPEPSIKRTALRVGIGFDQPDDPFRSFNTTQWLDECTDWKGMDYPLVYAIRYEFGLVGHAPTGTLHEHDFEQENGQVAEIHSHYLYAAWSLYPAIDVIKGAQDGVLPQFD